MGQDVRNDSRVCRGPPGPRKDLNWHLKPRTIFVAVGLSFILTTSMMYYLMLPPSPIITIPLQLTPHDSIAIDGDADFSDTALLEGWPGDGSPENPFIISRLDISSDAYNLPCIEIRNTRVSFIISHCNLSNSHWDGNSPPKGPYVTRIAGICLVNVANCVLINNTCSSNTRGIFLRDSDSNIVVNNNCSRNSWESILLWDSNSTTVANNTCNNNNWGGIILGESYSNTVVNNTCNNNDVFGISLFLNSDFNTVVNNTCNNNTAYGIYIERSDFNTVVNNICNNNDIGIFFCHYDEIDISVVFDESDYNTVANNTCNNNWGGINLGESYSNTVVNNICNNNDGFGISLHFSSEFNTVLNNTCNNNTEYGIYLSESNFNTVVNNTCNNNRIGIYLDDMSYSNTVANNTFVGNTEHDILGEYMTEETEPEETEPEESGPVFLLFIGFAGIIMLGLAWRRGETLS